MEHADLDHGASFLHKFIDDAVELAIETNWLGLGVKGCPGCPNTIENTGLARRRVARNLRRLFGRKAELARISP
jgi:hypothetical protein